MKSIFVGNLDRDASDETVRALFETYGPVGTVSVVRDRDTGQPRGFAFVEMTDGEQADKAISGLHGTMVGGRPINVNEARPAIIGGFRPQGGGPPRQKRDPRL